MVTDDRYTVETPENVEVHFELAGLGSRYCAVLLDTVLLLAVILALALVAALVTLLIKVAPMGGFGDALERSLTWVNALIASVVIALVSGGYYLLLEMLMHGQTPGKKAMGLRVVSEDGTAVTASEVLIRNFLRIVDFLPAAYALGGTVMFFHPAYRRLGDLAAGTIVIKEREPDFRSMTDRAYQLGPFPAVVNVELTADERRLIAAFLYRRVELFQGVRRHLAGRLAAPLYEKYGGQWGRGGEDYLDRLIEGRHHGT